MKILIASIIIICPAFAVTASEMTAAEIMQAIYDTWNQDHAYAVITMTINTSGGDKRTFKYQSWTKDKGEKNLIKYLEPSRVKGQATLMLNNADISGSNSVVGFNAGEMGPGMVVMHELSSDAQIDYTQGVHIHHGWNLLSWHIEPPDPDPSDFLEMQEILPEEGNDWFFDYEGEVYKYDLAGLHNSYPYLLGSGEWPWILDNAYYMHVRCDILWEFSHRPTFDLTDFPIEPNPAWDDTLDTFTIGTYTNGWFFMGYPGQGYTKLATVYVDPANPNGDPSEYRSPFHWLIWQDDPPSYPHIPFGQQYLIIVKTDDGKVYIPKDTNVEQSREIDQIGVLEPGRGYFLGFRQATTEIDFNGWADYPGWPQESIPQDPKSSQPQIASNSHFQFTEYTHWSYPVVIDTVDLEETPMAVGDEIGVFDGDQCVGASVYTGVFPMVIACWKDDIATPDILDGYIAGNEMTFVWYDASENQEVTFVPPPMISAVEDDPVAPTHSGFGVGVYAVRSFMNGIQSVQQLPITFKLGQNYPNPFNVETVIPLELPERSNVKIDLFNIRGQLVGTVFEGIENAGWPKIQYSASNLSSGVYFILINAEGLERGGKFTDVGKMLLLK